MIRRRRDPKLTAVSEALYTLLLWRDMPAACAIADRDQTGPNELFDLFDTERRHETAWHLIEDQAVREWVAHFPGTRPPSWWYWSALELRRFTAGDGFVIKGAERCHEVGLPFIANGWDDPPMVETEPGYLDRLGLWLPGERARVPADAFLPRRFSYHETTAPRGVPQVAA